MRRLVVGLLVSGVAAMGLAACGSMNGGGNSPSAAQPVSPQVYAVFFVGRSVELTADGHKIVATAARAAKSPGVSMVQVAGPSTQVTPHYDPGMAEPRMKLVEQELVADGVAHDKLVRTSLPTADAMVDTSGAQRVEIRILK